MLVRSPKSRSCAFMLDGTAVRVRLDRIHGGKGSFGAFTLDGIEFALFKQPRRELAQFGVVLDDQHRSTILLGLSHIYAPPLSVRYDPHPIVA